VVQPGLRVALELLPCQHRGLRRPSGIAMTAPTVLLTGATGYIASHTWLALLSAGFSVVGIDNFSNSSPEVLNRLRDLSGREPVFERLDVRDMAALEAVFQRHPIGAAVHFAALKA